MFVNTAHVLLLTLSYLLPFQQKETLGAFIPSAPPLPGFLVEDVQASNSTFSPWAPGRDCHIPLHVVKEKRTGAQSHSTRSLSDQHRKWEVTMT